MNFAGALRSELLEHARTYALSENLPHCLGYEGGPAICFEPTTMACGTAIFIQPATRRSGEIRSGRGASEKCTRSAIDYFPAATLEGGWN
jgi:hypothetical protein